MGQIKPLSTVIVICMLLATACSKRHIPESTTPPDKESATPIVKKAVVKKSPPIPVAKVIMVNDSVAKKNIDGRLYYDVGGHRYWRNYDDGKYYLFNKAMYNDKAFTPH